MDKHIRKINKRIKEVEWFIELSGLGSLKNKTKDIMIFSNLDGQQKQLVNNIILNTYLQINLKLDILVSNFFFNHCQNNYEPVVEITTSNRFKVFQSYILDEMPFLRKLSILKTFTVIPKEVIKNIEKINDLRNAVAHSLIPEKLKNDRTLYSGKSIYTKEGINLFNKEVRITLNFLQKEFVECFKKNPAEKD